MSEDTSSISRSNCKELQFDGYFSIELQQIWFRGREEKIIYEEFILRSIKYLRKIQSSIPPRKTRSSRGDGERVKRNGETFTSLEIGTMDRRTYAPPSTRLISYFSTATASKPLHPYQTWRERSLLRLVIPSTLPFPFVSLPTHTQARAHILTRTRSTVHKASSRASTLVHPTVLPRSSVEGGLGQPIAAMNK